jgi:methionyl-tRNA formyltransferase
VGGALICRTLLDLPHLRQHATKQPHSDATRAPKVHHRDHGRIDPAQDTVAAIWARFRALGHVSCHLGQEQILLMDIVPPSLAELGLCTTNGRVVPATPPASVPCDGRVGLLVAPSRRDPVLWLRVSDGWLQVRHLMRAGGKRALNASDFNCGFMRGASVLLT